MSLSNPTNDAQIEGADETFITRAAIEQFLEETGKPTREIGTTFAAQSTMLLDKGRQDEEVSRFLRTMKEDYARRMQKCKEREAEIEQKQQAFLAQVQKYEQWLRENDAKFAKFTKRAADDASFREARVREMQLVLKQLEEAKAAKAALQEDVNAVSRYRNYLAEYLAKIADDKEDSQSYGGIDDVVRRYKTLRKSQKDLDLKRQFYSDEAERIRNAKAALIRDSQNMFLVKSAKVVELQKELDARRQHLRRTDEHVSTQQADARELKQKLGAILVSIQNLYQRCCERSHRSTKENLTPREMLDVVELDIDKYMWVIQQLKTQQTATSPIAQQTQIAPSPAPTIPSGSGGTGPQPASLQTSQVSSRVSSQSRSFPRR